MRGVKPILVIVFSLLFCHCILFDMATLQEERYVSQITDNCYSFEIPNSYLNCKAEEVLDAIFMSCEKLELNLYRVDTCYSHEGKTIDIFCRFTRGTKALELLRVSHEAQKGFLEGKEIVLSSDRHKTSGNSSLIVKYPTNTEVTYYPFSIECYTNPIDGLYYIEGIYENCMRMGKEILTIMTKVYPDLEEIRVNEFRAEGTERHINQEKYILPFLVYLILLFSVTMEQRRGSQMAAVCLTGGMNLRKAQEVSFGKSFYLCVHLSIILTLGVVVWYGGSTVDLFGMFISILPLLLIDLVGYLYTRFSYVQSYSRLVPSGKINYYLGWSFLLVTKMIMSIFLFGTMLNTYVFINDALNALPTSYEWDEIADDYAVCPGLLVGMDETIIGKQINRNDISINAELYPILNERGAIYCAINYNEYEVPVVIVNPNYLARFPIFDTEGEAVFVSEDEEKMVLLSPYEKSRDQVLINMMRKWRKGLLDLENMYNVAPLTESMDIEIIHIAPYQSIFTVQPGLEHIVNAPVRIITECNTLVSERVGILGGGMTDPLKIKMENGCADETYANLITYLHSLRLTDNITSFVSLKDGIEKMKETTHNTITTSVLTLITMILLQSFFDALVIFIRLRDSIDAICVQLVNGVSITARYSSYFCLILIHLCFVQIIAQIYRAPIPFILIASSLVFVQFFATLILIHLFESRYVTTYLKGGLL